VGVADFHRADGACHFIGGIRIAENGTPHLSSIVADSGERWIDYRKTLTPHYGVVWRDIAIGFTSLVVGILVVVFVGELTGRPVTWIVGVLIAVWMGYWLHALFLYGHEAAHSNLAPVRRWNDRLGDWTVWLLFGSTTKNYRRTHMTHHSHLGDHLDTETSYHLCMSVLNVLKAATGIRVLEVILFKARISAERRRQRRGGRASGRAQGAAHGSGTSGGVIASLRSAALHLCVVGGLVRGGEPVAAASWLAAVGCVFPLLATIRTIVEHRRTEAACAVDFTVEVHGAVNRLFGVGLVSRYFGAAGFNRHLLHHWDPAISYTRFDEMERFFLRTPLAAEMNASRTSYVTQARLLTTVARHG
jgi:fatty acid desaturase